MFKNKIYHFFSEHGVDSSTDENQSINQSINRGFI